MKEICRCHISIATKSLFFARKVDPPSNSAVPYGKFGPLSSLAAVLQAVHPTRLPFSLHFGNGGGMGSGDRIPRRAEKYSGLPPYTYEHVCMLVHAGFLYM